MGETELERKVRWQREWNKAHPEAAAHIARKARYKRKYGITLAQYDAMLEEQANTCAICGEPPFGVRLAVDHSHTTGKVRGLLCSSCNSRLGVLESEEFTKRARAYLARYK